MSTAGDQPTGSAPDPSVPQATGPGQGPQATGPGQGPRACHLRDVPCLKCGDGVACEVDLEAPTRLLVFCSACRRDLLEAPALPGGYELVRELGRGGMGAVYLARHRALGVARAIKVILPVGAVSEEACALFLEEARVQAGLNHPRIVQVHDLCETRPAVLAIVMEYVEGPDASALLREVGGKGLTPRAAVGIVAQGLEALDYVHRRAIVHCDVKDPNLLVAGGGPGGEGGQTKLSDFGLARTFALTGASSRRRSEAISGTLRYMSPEQASGVPVGPASDLYSMGVTLYHLLTGAWPHAFPDGVSPLDIIRTQPAEPLLARAPGLPRPLAEAVDRSLASRPDQRFPTAEAMREALLEAVGGG